MNVGFGTLHGFRIDVLVGTAGEPWGAGGEKDQIASADVADSLRRTLKLR